MPEEVKKGHLSLWNWSCCGWEPPPVGAGNHLGPKQEQSTCAEPPFQAIFQHFLIFYYFFENFILCVLIRFISLILPISTLCPNLLNCVSFFFSFFFVDLSRSICVDQKFLKV